MNIEGHKLFLNRTLPDQLHENIVLSNKDQTVRLEVDPWKRNGSSSFLGSGLDNIPHRGIFYLSTSQSTQSNIENNDSANQLCSN